MNNEDLIKKLEKIDLIDIKLKSHQSRLKMALLNSEYFKEKKNMNPIMFWTKRLVPAGVALALILVVGFTVINPKLQVARAMEIAKNDPQIQQLIKDYGVEIKEVKLENGKAYALLGLSDEKSPKDTLIREETGGYPSQLFTISFNADTGESEFFTGSIVEIDLKGKKVENIESIKGNNFSLGVMSTEVRDRAIEIVKSDPNVELPKNAEVTEVRPMPPLKLKLETTLEGKITAVPSGEKEDKKMAVVYKSPDEKSITIIIVNIDKGVVEGGGQGGMMTAQEEMMNEGNVNRGPLYEGDTILEPLESTSENASGNVGKIESQADNEFKMYLSLLEEIGEKDQRIKNLLKDNDYNILEAVTSEPITVKTDRGYTTSVETATVVLEKISTGDKYWITIDLANNTIKSIEKK